MKKTIALIAAAMLSVSVAQAQTKPADKPAPVKPVVKKPCKEGQTEEKDGCHELKKIEKKAPPKKDEKKK